MDKNVDNMKFDSGSKTKKMKCEAVERTVMENINSGTGPAAPCLQPRVCSPVSTSWLKEVVTKSEIENRPMETIQDHMVRYDNTLTL
ncbi:hypothetical protein EYF80_048524 [Liparis tanakae]|uniref:Uncharacterized protein n=1 Tax=Liparis tanakae TaxID=230148 RepID=A0A4Z2FK37_9TELE|nr:hypothetical protein EYF80_048524 [Liparis tanakae]